MHFIKNEYYIKGELFVDIVIPVSTEKRNYSSNDFIITKIQEKDHDTPLSLM